MKTNILLFLLAFALQGIFAQSPALINYQAVVRDANGNLINSGTISLGISIHDAIVGGNQLYFETHNGITPNAFGVVNVLIGGGTVLAGNFLMINWGNGNKYLQVYVNSNPIGSRTQMVSVPYALYANKADSSNYATAALKATTADTATNLKNAPVITTGWGDYIMVEEQKPPLTDIPSVVGFQTRELNTVTAANGNAISFDLATHTITLLPGTYHIVASAPSFNVANNQLLLRNTVTSLPIALGQSTHSNNGNASQAFSSVDCIITIGTTTTFKMDHNIAYARASGLGTSGGYSGVNGVFARCFVQKIQ